MTPRELAFAVGRLAFAATAVIAMTFQFATLDATLATFSPGNFFSFFTIQSNILAVVILVAAALLRPAERTPAFDAVRGAATLYMGITGLVFALLLSGLQEQLDTHIGWVDFVVHKLMPVVVVADWLLDPPRARLRLGVALAWLAYPAAWLAYTLIRGASVGWYPYPFVDVDRFGYDGVLGKSVFLLAGFVVAAVAVAAAGNALGRRRAPALGNPRHARPVDGSSHTRRTP